MYECVSPAHPDKQADRVAGAIVDLAYKKQENPRIAVEVLIGHGKCHIIAETSVSIDRNEVVKAVRRIAGNVDVDYVEVPQDVHLANNQKGKIRCGDNGIFKGVPVTEEQKKLSIIARDIYETYHSDGKYILDKDRLIICQSNASSEELRKIYKNAEINPLGDWTGGTDVDTGATNRKLGSDMGDSVTGGGLCLSGDTEFLSDDFKWHKISEYKQGQKVSQYNNGKLEFVLPQKYIANDEEELIHFYNKTKLSMCLTPEHDVLILTSKGNLVKRKAKDIAKKIESKKGHCGSIIHNFFMEHKVKTTKYKNENMYRLQVAFCADGTILNNIKLYNGRIRVKKEYKKERLRELLKGTNFKETKDNEYSIFWVNVDVKSKSLYECFKDENWGILYDEIYRWDGDIKRKLFRTTKKEDADFIQLVIHSLGKVAVITKDKKLGSIRRINNKEYVCKSSDYTVHELVSNKTGLRKNKDSFIKIERTKGKSYCFVVDSHNLIVRHNDRIFITGNCGKDLSKADVSINIYAWLKAQKTHKVVEISCAIGDEYVDGKPYSEIVKIAKKYIDSLGGFEKFAEWGLI